MRVAVCLITYQRLEGLKRLLDGLNQLTFNKCESPDLEIIVIDNDSHGSGWEFCQHISSEFNWKIHCEIEHRRGIPYARNKAIACAIKNVNVDFVAFIDDDEVPEPSWLDELLYVQKSSDAHVVSGTVLPYFETLVPEWIIQGNFFERPRYSTGYILQSAATNNVIISAELLKNMDKLFDERLALSGGEDWHFFQRLTRDGYKIVWANDAVVYEWIPTSRANIAWLLKRSYRLGITESFCAIDLEPSFLVRANCIFKGVRRIIIGVFSLPLSFIQGQHQFIKNLRYIYHSTGLLAGVAGIKYEEYKTIHTV